MTKLQTCLSAALALVTAIIIGCANLPPITGTYTGNDGNTVVIGSSTNGITIIYTEHCQDCGAGSRSQHPRPITPRSATHAHRATPRLSWITGGHGALTPTHPPGSTLSPAWSPASTMLIHAPTVVGPAHAPAQPSMPG